MLCPAQHINRLIEAVPDHPAFPDRDRRFLLDRIQDQLINVLKPINILLNSRKLFLLEPLQNFFDGGQHFERVAERYEVPRIRRLIGHLAQKSFQIVDRIQVFPDLIA